MGKYRRIILTGDSMIEFFDWQERLPDLKVKNLGRAGESVEELQIRAEGIVRRHEPPDLALVMIGTNNVATENFSFLPSYEGILTTFCKGWPDTTLVVNSLLPMALEYLDPGAVQRVNGSLKLLAARNGAVWLDVWASMVDRNGRPLEGVLEDEVHLSSRGYRIWADILEEFLNQE